MEEKKNNAVEKVEQAIKDKPKQNNNTKKTNVNNKGKKKNLTKNSQKKTNLQKRRQELKQKRMDKLAKREELKLERQKIKAQKKLELNSIKAHKKAEKEKRKAVILRAKNAKRLEVKLERERIKQEREAKRQALKQETKAQRQQRLAKEKQEKLALKREKMQRRNERRREKAQERAKRRKENKGFGGWLAAVISLGVASLILASVLTYTLIMPSTEETLLEMAYKKAFYDTTAQVDSMDVNLSKVLATSDEGAIQGYLLDLAVESELAENNIQQLPLEDESKFYTTKLINQIGDFSKYLSKKIANGEKVTEADQELLVNLYQANLTLKNALLEVNEQSNGEFNFTAMANGSKNSFVTENFNKLQNLSVEYPELIYDGPFSDGKDEREIKGISGEQITPTEAISIFNKAFGTYGITDIEERGEATGIIECYNIVAQSDKGEIFAQVSKTGGKIIMFSIAGDCNSVEYSSEHAIQTASDFLESIGVMDMQEVWMNLSGNVYTINFAYSIKGIPVYSDLIKVRVCAQTDTVLGMEALSYYTNHTERIVSKPSLSKAQAVGKISTNIEVQNVRLAIVPFGESAEKLCYEIMGEYDGSIYYVYIDAVSGRQIEMFKVVESTEGTLLA